MTDARRTADEETWVHLLDMRDAAEEQAQRTREAVESFKAYRRENGQAAQAEPPPLDVGRIAQIFEGPIGDRLYFFGAAYGYPKDESFAKIAADFAAEYTRLGEDSE